MTAWKPITEEAVADGRLLLVRKGDDGEPSLACYVASRRDHRWGPWCRPGLGTMEGIEPDQFTEIPK